MMSFFIVIGILSLDQLTKFLIVKNLHLHQSIPIIPGLFNLTHIHNRGAAFGIFTNQIVLFVITSIIAISLILRGLSKGSYGSIQRRALAFILAGALGNLIDRAAFGYVIDFLDFRIWPVFNIADSAITIGAVMLGWSLLTQKAKCKSAKRSEASPKGSAQASPKGTEK